MAAFLQFDSMQLTPSELVEIGIIFLVLYAFLRFLRGTIAGAMFRGSAMLLWLFLIGFILVIRDQQMEILLQILRVAMLPIAIGLIVIFQTELRAGVARLGQASWLRRFLRFGARQAQETRAAEEIVSAVTAFAAEKTGALIAIERNIDLSTYADTGVPMDALIRAETLDTIFSTHTVLHDGAVIVRGDRVAAAGCLLPLTERPELARTYGTRHRAAIGLSEQSDAVVVVVSEERGDIHLAERGQLNRYSDPDWLLAYLNVVFAEKHGLAPAEELDRSPSEPPPPAPSQEGSPA